MIFDFDWFSQPGVQNVLSFIYTIIDVLRIVVPIGLIVMTTMDVVKKVINPEDKEGQKKIMYRALAAVIIFLIPTFINIVFNILGIDMSNVKLKTTSTPTATPKPTIVPTAAPTTIPTTSPIATPTPSPTPTIDPNTHVTSLKFTNCPDSSKIYHNYDEITLETDVPNTYKGTVDWDITSGSRFVTIIKKDNSSIKFNLSNIIYESTITFEISTDGKKNTCTINVEQEKLSSVSITNCPNKAIYFKPGEKIILNTDIPADFKGEIKWNPDNFNNNFIITPSSDKRSATLEVIASPLSTFSTTTVVAGGKASACLINVQKEPQLSSVSITNCPDSSYRYNPGDKITLYTDIPADFKGEIKWNPDSNHNNFKITPSSDKRSATLEVIASPISTFSTTTVVAGGKASACLINVQKDPQLSSLSITNCPDKSTKYKPGDKITLYTDIPSTFKGEVDWIPDSFNNNFIITPNKDKRSATLEVIASPTSTFSTTTVRAGGKASACLIYVSK